MRRTVALLEEPSRVGEMASPLFCESLRDDLSLEFFLDIHLAKPLPLLLQLFHASHEGGIHAAELGPPLLERCRADTELPAQLWDRQASFCSLECINDLALGKT